MKNDEKQVYFPQVFLLKEFQQRFFSVYREFNHKTYLIKF